MTLSNMRLDERMLALPAARGAEQGVNLTADKSSNQAGDAKLRKATEEFEGMLIGQMLQSIRESALGGWQENHDQSGAVALEMAERQLAQVMAAQGGMGIARTLQASMERHKESAAKPAPEKASRIRLAPSGSGG